MKANGKQDIGTVRTPEPALGFHAKLDGASLWDLVQMECLARSRLVVEVTGEGGVGYLYFDEGRVVHASTLRQRGEAAALEILAWTTGTFQESNRSWPSSGPTIDVSHESLLLNAAKRLDDSRASNLVAFPGRGIDAVVDAALDEIELLEIDPEDSEAGEVDMRSPDVTETSLPAPLRGESAADFPVMVRLSASGTVLRNKGGSEDLAEATAYAHRLVQLTGELLGLEDFMALECTFTQGRCLMFTEGEGDIVVLRPRPDLDLRALRERLGL
jgi:Domain of unknown function (DUF4388)